VKRKFADVRYHLGDQFDSPTGTKFIIFFAKGD